MIVEDQLDGGAGRIGGIEKLEEFDELAAAVTVSNESVDGSSEQINPGQQAERAIAFVLMIPREGAWTPGTVANPAPSSRWPGFPVSRRRRRSPPASPACSAWRRLFSGPGPRDRRTEPPPFSARTRRRDFPDSSAPCAARYPLGRGSCTP